MRNLRLVLGIFGLLAVQAQGVGLSHSIQHVKPSIAILGTYQSTSSPRFTLRGTGFIVSESPHGTSNLVVTSAHVLVPPAPEEPLARVVIQIRVEPGGWQMRDATVLAMDPVHDLALLRFSGPSAPALTVRDSARIQEGQSIAFMGFPIGGALGFSPVTHRGTISSIAAAALPSPSAQRLRGDAIRSLRAGNFEIFQLDATAYPGNSGGPLFDPETGEVLGVVNMALIKGTHESALTHPSGISYAIPSSFILALMEHTRASAP